jgi:O-antigen/teichoic acid export membrane protein
MIKKLSLDIVIYGLTNGLKALVPFLMLPILTAYLSTEEFAILSLIEVSILFLFPLVSLNVYAAINVEYFHLKKNQLSSFISNAILISFISFVSFLVIFLLFSKQIEQYVHIQSGIIILLPTFAFLRLLPQVLLGLMQVEQKSKYYFLFMVVQVLIDFSLSYILIVFYNMGYLGRLEGIYVSAFLMSSFALYYLYNYGFIRVVTLQYTRRILNFSLPLVPHILGGVIIAMSDRYFIVYYDSHETLAYYTVAYQVAALMLLFGTSINQAWSPFLFRLLKEKNKFTESIKYTGLLMGVFLILGFILYLFKDIVFLIFVDEKFYEGKEYFVWLLIGFIFQSLYFLVTNFIFFKKRTKILAKVTFSGAILNLILNYFFIQEFDVIGVAYATALTWAVFFLVVFVMVVNIYKKER